MREHFHHRIVFFHENWRLEAPQSIKNWCCEAPGGYPGSPGPSKGVPGHIFPSFCVPFGVPFWSILGTFSHQNFKSFFGRPFCVHLSAKIPPRDPAGTILDVILEPYLGSRGICKIMQKPLFFVCFCDIGGVQGALKSGLFRRTFDRGVQRELRGSFF